MFQFLHAADIHLDSPLRGLERYPGAPVQEIRLATRRAFERLVELAIREKVSFVVLAGDLFDGNWKDYNTGLYFAAQMARLRESGIKAFIIAGNHDAENKMTRTLRMPENVKVLSSQKAETVLLEDIGAAIHGQSFASPAVTNDISEGYPAAASGFFNIGLLHTCASGREGHEKYAPCSLSGLLSKHYDYWALGHVHAREILNEKPLVVFPGNLQGRHARETGAKGCMVVSVDDKCAASARFETLDVMRWANLAIDAGDCLGIDDVLERFSERLLTELQNNGDLPLAARVEILGRSAGDDRFRSDPQRLLNEIRSAAIDRGAGRVWVEKVKLLTSRADSTELAAASEGPIAELLSFVESLREDPLALVELGQELKDLHKKLPQELKDSSDLLDPSSVPWLGKAVLEARDILMSRLSAAGRS